MSLQEYSLLTNYEKRTVLFYEQGQTLTIQSPKSGQASNLPSS